MHWALLIVVALVGALVAYVRGAQQAAQATVPPPAVDGMRWAAQAQGLIPLGWSTTQPPAAVVVPVPGASRTASQVALSLAADGIPLTALDAYRGAQQREQALRPGCHLPWQLVAAIGRVESDHGRFAGAVLYSDGLSDPPVIGIPLDGNGTALIRDTDHGALDGDPVYDRAVGPMQFIPSTWAAYGVDANGDGVADPFNIFDAAAAAGDYLCTAGGDLATVTGQRRAVDAYNHSAAYVALVLQTEAAYSDGAAMVVGLAVPSAPSSQSSIGDTPPTESEPVASTTAPADAPTSDNPCPGPQTTPVLPTDQPTDQTSDPSTETPSNTSVASTVQSEMTSSSVSSSASSSAVAAPPVISDASCRPTVPTPSAMPSQRDR